MKKLLIAAASTGIFLFAGCSQDSSDFKESAEALIESDTVEAPLKSTFTGASCNEPAKVEVDETFSCTAVDADGEKWNFLLIIRTKGTYEVTGALPENPETFIEGSRIETLAGTTFTDATCTDPATQDVGATFTCTAVDASGLTWDFDLVLTPDGLYEISPGWAPRG